MKRKVIQQGPSTLMISLPSKWVKQNSIVKGEELEVIEEEHRIILNSAPLKERKTVHIDISDVKTTAVLTSIISNLFIRGYKRIEIKYMNIAKTKTSYFKEEMKTLSIIEKLVTDFIGVEIIERKEGFCVLEEITDIDPKAFQKTFDRGFLLLLQYADYAKKKLQNLESEKENNAQTALSHFYHLENTFFRYANKLLQYTEYSNDDKKRLHGLLHTFSLIGFTYASFAQFYHADDATLKLFDITKEVLQNFYAQYTKPTIEGLNKLSSELNEAHITLLKEKNQNILLLNIINILTQSIIYLPLEKAIPLTVVSEDSVQDEVSS